MKDNKLIAEFMGVHDEISLDSIAGNIHSWSDSPFFYITEDSKDKVMEGIAKYSKYHTSWDWLMPVVNKIEIENEGVPLQLLDCNLYSEIGEVYQAVVEFIKTYNDER
tara:strand:+ start:171 stop:494 length:324 start_codon:yes stop_codon:yes gene_type:complete